MHLKKLIAIFLCVTMVLGSTLTSFAVEDLEINENQEKVEEVLESNESTVLNVGEETEEKVTEEKDTQVEEEPTEVSEESSQ